MGSGGPAVKGRASTISARRFYVVARRLLCYGRASHAESSFAERRTGEPDQWGESRGVLREAPAQAGGSPSANSVGEHRT